MTILESTITDAADNRKAQGTPCPAGLCSIGLMKSGCPTCLVLGLAMLPFEFVFRKLKGRSSPSTPINR